MNNNPIPARRNPRRANANANPVYVAPARRQRVPVNPIPANPIPVNNNPNNNVIPPFNGPVNNLQDYRDRYVGPLTQELMKIPKSLKKKEFPHMEIFERHQILYSDIVYMPEDEGIGRVDGGYKFMLVCVDGATNNCDMEEMKFRDAPTTLLAFRNILSRRFITLPYQFIITDNDYAFKNEFDVFLTQNNIIHRCERLARHSQLSIVNNLIRTLSSAINIRMANDEVNNPGLINKEWRRGLGELRRILNRPEYLKIPPQEPNVDNPVLFNVDNQNVLPINSSVRIKLDHPVNADGTHLFGKFRSGDLRWSSVIYTIQNLVLNLGQPVMYKINTIENCLFLRKQLKPVRIPANPNPN